ncbi:MAG: hydrolase [Clostridiaceae bacterium]|jgi:8-oxo-dGTP diphosphatase|nr:hydrolase [Clostridiaceae bacterium]
MKVNFYDFNSIEDKKLKFAVIMADYNGKWVFVKHKERSTWEIPGGHRENDEEINSTASRELFEETGAAKFEITPVCIYSVVRENNELCTYDESFGALFYANIFEIGKLPNFEIGEVNFFHKMPNELTYPLIQPYLFQKVCDLII